MNDQRPRAHESGSQAGRQRNDIVSGAIENFLFVSRWLQLPLLIGLLVALVLLAVQFAIDVAHALARFATLTRLEVILLTLDLIDMVLIANLVIMVVLSGYQIFIASVSLPGDPRGQSFAFGVGAGQLKFRIATTIVLISTIHMLHAFLDEQALSTAMMIQLAVFQALFLATAVTLAMLSRSGARGRDGTQRTGP